MRRAIEDELSTDQLRRIDRWILASLASFVATAFLAALLFSGQLGTQYQNRSADGAASPPRHVKQTTGAAGSGQDTVIDAAARNAMRMQEHSYYFAKPGTAQSLVGPKHNHGEQREGLPVIY